MAWEQRRGRLYFYLKVRQGNRVVSRYIGSGVRGEIAAALIEQRVADRTDAREKKREGFRDVDALLSALAECSTSVDETVRELLTNSGCHRPSRHRWRRKRGG